MRQYEKGVLGIFVDFAGAMFSTSEIGKQFNVNVNNGAIIASITAPWPASLTVPYLSVVMVSSKL